MNTNKKKHEPSTTWRNQSGRSVYLTNEQWLELLPLVAQLLEDAKATGEYSEDLVKALEKLQKIGAIVQEVRGHEGT